jgi:hypothetical protein
VTHEEFCVRASRNFYVRQLACMKMMFGGHSSIGIVQEGSRTMQCRTVADLQTAGIDCSPASLELDQHWDALRVPSPAEVQRRYEEFQQRFDRQCREYVERERTMEYIARCDRLGLPIN